MARRVGHGLDQDCAERGWGGVGELDHDAHGVGGQTRLGEGLRARICAQELLDVLVDNAGVSHYMPPADLPAGKASELAGVKALAPTQLMRAAVGPCRSAARASS